MTTPTGEHGTVGPATPDGAYPIGAIRGLVGMHSDKVVIAVVIGVSFVVTMLIVGITLSIVIGRTDPNLYLNFLSGGAIASILGAVSVTYLAIASARLKRVEHQTNGTTSALVAHNMELTNHLVESNIAVVEHAAPVVLPVAPVVISPDSASPDRGIPNPAAQG